MKRYDIPKHSAYHDGTRYHCLKIECFHDGANLKKIDRIQAPYAMTYTPILRCTQCGTTYFGLITHDCDAEEAINEYHEQQKQAEEERTNAVKEDNAAIIEDITRHEEEQEQILREEIERHCAEEDGDIILPHILTA